MNKQLLSALLMCSALSLPARAGDLSGPRNGAGGASRDVASPGMFKSGMNGEKLKNVRHLDKPITKRTMTKRAQ